MVCGLKYRQVKVRASVGARACGDRFGSEAGFDNLIAQGLGVDVDNGYGYGYWPEYGQDGSGYGNGRSQPKSSGVSGQGRAGPVTGG